MIHKGIMVKKLGSIQRFVGRKDICPATRKPANAFPAVAGVPGLHKTG